ncbi:MAG: thermonuclease family protein [Pyrinomonadaceae bacterium]|nr:thermonuclease family protein [Pyrinomonadaceae bacterium]
MRKTAPILSAFLTLLLATSAFSQSKLYGTVTQVIDGKTIVVVPQAGMSITLELQYIEVPEAQQPLHSTVKDHLKKLLLNQTVMFEPNGMALDKTVGRVYLNGVDISQQMIRDGAAWHSASEKKNQEAGESLLYEENQARAKAEKRGVWSIEGMKPAWQFRAELREKKRREKVEKIKAMQAAARAKLAAQPKPKSRRSKSAGNMTAGFGIETWSNSPKTYAQKLGGYDNLYFGSTPKKDASYIVTDQTFPLVRAGKVSQKLDMRTIYVSKGELYNPYQHVYFIAMISSSKNFRFHKSNSLTLTLDGKKMYIGRSFRMFRNEPGGVGELLLVPVTRKKLSRIAKARNIRMKVGNFSGAAKKEYSDMLIELLDATK